MLPLILIAEDHPLTAEGMRCCLTALPAAIKVTHTPEEMLAILASTPFDLLVLDLCFSNSPLSGFDLLRECQNRIPGMPVLIASMHADTAIQNEARRAGAQGFISKMAPTHVLLGSVRGILAGDTSFPAPPPTAHRTLTPRQIEITQHLLHGFQEKEIASILGLGLRTVESHLHRAKHMFGARSLGHYVALFFERGLSFLPKRGRGQDRP